MTDLSLSNSLTDLAARIRSEHEAATAAMRRSLVHAMAAGELLLEAKAQLKHGQWMPWLAEHCGISDRSARVYMRLARNRQALEQNGSAADLSLRGAIDALAPAREETADRGEDDDLPPIPLAEGELEIPIDDVKFRPDLYMRTPISSGGSAGDPDVVDRYRHFLRELPAIEINQRNEIIDGVYRWLAHRQAGAKTIRAFVTEVASNLEHQIFAVQRNATHGLQLPLDVELRRRDERRAQERLERSIAKAAS